MKYKSYLAARKVKALSKKRVGKEKLQEVEDWIQQYQAFHSCFNFPPECIFNVDESRIRYSDTNIRFEHIDAKNRERAQNGADNKSTLGTLLVFINAAGEFLIAFLVLRFDDDHPDGGKITRLPTEVPIKHSRGKFPIRYLFTNTGCLNADIFNLVMKNFLSIWQMLNPSQPCIILMDNLGIHYQQQLFIDLAKELCLIFFFVEYTSHWSQPLDSSPFANWKSELAQWRWIGQMLY